MDRKPTYDELEQRFRELERRVAEYDTYAFIRNVKLRKALIRMDTVWKRIKTSRSFYRVLNEARETLQESREQYQAIVTRMIDKRLSYEELEERVRELESELADRELDPSERFLLLRMARRGLGKVLRRKWAIRNFYEVLTSAREAMLESAEKYRAVLANLEDGYYEVDLAGNLTFFNPAMSKYLGYAKDELMGMNNRQFMTAESAKEAYRVFNEVYRTGRPAQARDWEAVAKDGATMPCEISVSLVRDSKGRPIGFRGIARDITERKRAEGQARMHQEQLFQASKMVALGTLVSSVAHEINNPNNFIMLNTPILLEAWENARPILEEYYGKNGDFLLGGMNYSQMRDNIPLLFSGILDGSARIKQIVDDLKQFVRQDSPDLTQSIDINAVLKSALSLVSNLITKSTNHFRIDYGEGLPLISGNFQRLEQVIINLIQNACQALPDPHRGIAVLTCYRQDTRTILVSIKDEGIGIPPESLPHVTAPFFTTKQDKGGIGLGLSISSRIVEEHGGKMTFTSEPDRGTTVEVILPVQRPRTETAL
ncbi:MAG: two-component system sensor histidine kinase NtrB [Nitrospirota bacterium]